MLVVKCKNRLQLINLCNITLVMYNIDFLAHDVSVQINVKPDCPVKCVIENSILLRSVPGTAYSTFFRIRDRVIISRMENSVYFILLSIHDR